MNTPIISWYIKENNDYIQDQEYYLGSYNPDSEISLQVQVWNNRYNQSEVSSINDARFVIYFENIEDMNELDIIEMVCDWYARSMQYKTDFLS